MEIYACGGDKSFSVISDRYDMYPVLGVARDGVTITHSLYLVWDFLKCYDTPWGKGDYVSNCVKASYQGKF